MKKIIFILGLFLMVSIVFASEDPKFCSQDSDCKIKYNVLYDNVCSAGCFHDSVTSSTSCDLKWEPLIGNCGCVDNKCTPGSGTEVECTDSDDGKNYYVKGSISGKYIETNQDVDIDDVCTLNEQLIGSCEGTSNCKIVEYYCENAYVNLTTYKCLNGCKDGACISTSSSIPEILLNQIEKSPITTKLVEWRLSSEEDAEKIANNFIKNTEDELGVSYKDLKFRETIFNIPSANADVEDYHNPTATVVYKQYYDQIPVFDAELRIGINAYGTVWSVKSNLITSITAPTSPILTSEESIDIVKEHFDQTDVELEKDPQLYIFSHPSSLYYESKANKLVYRLNILSPIFKEIMVDSQNGEILLERQNIVSVPPEEEDTEQIPVEIEPDKEEEILDNDLLFYFYSETCRHCSGMDEELNKVKNKLKISITKSDITKDSDLAKKYSIRAVPSLVFIKEDGSFIKREGKTDYLKIIEWIKSSANVAFEEPESEEEIPEEVYEIPVEEEEDEEVTYFCSGCLKDNKCYPFGYRKSGDYCSDSEQFVNQLEAGKSCDNNFECKSNVCVNDECISGGLLRQILDWLRGLFGG